MLYVILLYMLMILLSTLSAIRHLICGHNWNWLLNLSLIYETLWAGVGSGLLISMLEKIYWFYWTGLITLVLLMWKWMGLFLRKNHLLRCWGWLSLLNWIRALTLSRLLKVPPRKLEPWYAIWKFLSPKVTLYLYKSTIQQCMEYYCHVWVGFPSSYLEFLDKLQNWICRTIRPSLAASLQSFAHCLNVASLFYIYYFGRCSSGLAELIPLP